MLQFSALIDAYMNCRRSKRSSISSLGFEIDYEHNLWDLYCEIVEGRYEVSSSIAFIVNKPVKREVFAAQFRDRVVHHLLIEQLIPKFEREFIYDCYACRPNRGTLFGINRVRKFIAKCSKGYTEDCYILKCDILGFFMNIDREMLWQRLSAFVEKQEFSSSDEDSGGESDDELKVLLLELIRKIIANDPIKDVVVKGDIKEWDGLPYQKSLFGVNGMTMPGYIPDGEKREQKSLKGVPIGNLTSQWFGNFYLNSFDHYMKHTLGVKYYGRYVDDFVVVHSDKEYLKWLICMIRDFLENLGLELHPKKLYLQHYSKGVEFLGVILKGGTIITGKRMRSGLREKLYRLGVETQGASVVSDAQLHRFRDVVNSYWGLMRHHSSYGLRRKSAKLFPRKLNNKVSYRGYRKISIKKRCQRKRYSYIENILMNELTNNK